MMPSSRTSIAGACLGLMVVALVAAPATAQRPTERQRTTGTTELRTATTGIDRELAARPSSDDTRLLESTAAEQQLVRHERLLRQAQGIDRMDERRAQALLTRIQQSEEQLVQTVMASIGYQGLEPAEKQSCVDERQDCKSTHGAMSGCGIQFMACLIAVIRGKHTVGDPVIRAAPRPNPDGAMDACF